VRDFGREFQAVGLAEFDAGDESALADLVDGGVGGLEGGEAGAEVFDFGGRVFRGFVRVRRLEAGERGGAAERVGGVTMAVVERAFRRAEEGVVDGGGGEGGGHRQVPPVSPLARQRKSGVTFSCWQANIFPVRPKPVMTSSRMRWTPFSSHHARRLASMPGGHGRISLTPWMSGSMTTAAMLRVDGAEFVEVADVGDRVAVAA
jgi:hypothetical protein